MDDDGINAFLRTQPDLAAQIRQVAQAAAEAHFGPGKATFADVEDFAHLVGRAVARQAAVIQVERMRREEPDRRPCPECGRICDASLDYKTTSTRDGTVDLPESRCRCVDCRRSFFPRQTAAGAAADPLQPADDRSPPPTGGRRRRRLRPRG